MARVSRAGMGERISAIGAQSGHPNPSEGIQESFLGENDCVEIIAVHGLSLVAASRLLSSDSTAVACGLRPPQHVEPFLSRDQARVPCTDRRTPNH